jgi:hypothetical protein
MKDANIKPGHIMKVSALLLLCIHTLSRTAQVPIETHQHNEWIILKTADGNRISLPQHLAELSNTLKHCLQAPCQDEIVIEIQ